MRSRSCALIVDHRGLGDAERGILGGGFHEQRGVQPPRHRGPLAAREHHELRRRDAVDRPAAACTAPCRARAAGRADCSRCRVAHQLEEGHHVLVVGDDAVEFLEQVEDDVGLPVDDRAAQLRQAVAEARAAAPRGPTVAACEMTSYSVRHSSISFSGRPSSDSGGTRLECTTHQGPQLLHTRTRGSWRSVIALGQPRDQPAQVRAAARAAGRARTGRSARSDR